MICQFELRFADVAPDFASRFEPELRRLDVMANDGLLMLDTDGVRVTTKAVC